MPLLCGNQEMSLFRYLIFHMNPFDVGSFEFCGLSKPLELFRCTHVGCSYFSEWKCGIQTHILRQHNKRILACLDRKRDRDKFILLPNSIDWTRKTTNRTLDILYIGKWNQFIVWRKHFQGIEIEDWILLPSPAVIRTAEDPHEHLFKLEVELTENFQLLSVVRF